MNSRWVTDLSNYLPTKEGHWPAYVAGFNLSLSGRIWLSDNKAIHVNKPKAKGLRHPCHRDIIDGTGKDETVYSGLYCWGKNEATLWLYPHCEMVFNESMLAGLKSLVGVHLITTSTKVYSNTWRNIVASLDGHEIISKHPQRQAA